MQSAGLTVRGPHGEFTVHPRSTDDLGVVRDADVIFITLKAHSIPAVAPRIGASLRPDACVVGATNGIPWWYFPDRHLDSVDPGGVIARSIPAEQVVGCVVYPAASLVEPGVIVHEEGDRFSLGEPDGTRSERVRRIAAMLAAAGFKAPVQTRLRNEIWLKVVGNATLNPISAITRATQSEMFQSASSRELIRTLMEEVESVARALDVELPVGIDKRMAGAAAVGEHRTSMLQDIEAKKPLELDGLLGAVIEIAGWKDVPVPSLRTLYGLAKLSEAVALQAD
jgi:2-dehydropantoate 2-reductase